MGDFDANVLADIPDPLNTGGQEWEIEVTLPNMTCDNCTLQLVQAMHGDTENPILDPASVSSYYTCVDVQLVAPGTLAQEPPPGQDPAAEQPEATPPGDEAAAPVTPGAAPEGEGAPGDGSDGPQGGGAEVAGSGAETPLIPVGEVPATDAPGSPGAASPPLAMAPAPASPAAPAAVGVGNVGSLDNSGGASSASGGCGLGTVAASAAPLEVLGLGLLAALAMRRRRSDALGER